MKITVQMRRMVRDVEYAKVVAQMVDAQDAMRAYEQRHKFRPETMAPKLVKGSSQFGKQPIGKPPTY